MSNFLREEERKELRQQHRKERDRRTADRIKAVLWSDDGWSYKQIAKLLFLDEETVSKHVDEYRSSQKLDIESGGSESKLSEAQTQELMGHLEVYTYVKVVDICEYVNRRWGVVYTVQGMYSWLKNHKFSYKKSK